MKCWVSVVTIKAVKQKRIVYRKLKCSPSDYLQINAESSV